MELLKSLKIDVEGPSSETLGNLTSLSLDTSLSLREKLFKQALTLNLTEMAKLYKTKTMLNVYHKIQLKDIDNKLGDPIINLTPRTYTSTFFVSCKCN